MHLGLSRAASFGATGGKTSFRFRRIAMRLALIATTAAAAIAVPFMVSAAGPRMSSDQFLSSVRCVAYQDVSRAGDDLGIEKMRLNSEARRQPAETAAQARTEVGVIAEQAAGLETAEERAMMRRARTNACSQVA